MAETAIIQRFGEKLRALREAHSLNQTQFARHLGLTAHGYISEIEAGKKLPTLEFALKTARLFHVSLDSLVKDELEIELLDRGSLE